MSFLTILGLFPTILGIFRQQDMSQSDFHTILSPGNRRYRRRIKTPLNSTQLESSQVSHLKTFQRDRK